MDEKGVFIQTQNTIVSSKALVLVNCLNTPVHDCYILYRSKHKCFDYAKQKTTSP